MALTGIAQFNFRTVFLRSWQKDGPPEQYWITAFFEPGDFLISIRYIASLRCGRPFHEMVLQCRFDADSEEPLDEENKVNEHDSCSSPITALFLVA